MKKLPLYISLLACVSMHAKQSTVQSEQNKSKPQAQVFEQGDALLPRATIEGYSYPARVNLKDGYDVTASASYIYWLPSEGGLDIATTALYDNTTSRASPATPKSHPIFQSSEFQSGFKLGLGFADLCDDWMLRADYTYLHQQTTLRESVPVIGDGLTGTVPAFYFTNWFFQVLSQGQGPDSTAFTSKWHLNLDWVDLALQRSFYSGRKLILTPFMGLRGAWFRQKLNIDVEEVLNSVPPSTVVTSHNRSQNWGLGPRLGAEGRYLLGAGVRLQGEVGGTLLFTQYRKIAHSEGSFSIGSTGVAYEMRNYNVMTPMAEANLGIGWGSYFSNQRWHFDLSATYEFNYFWAQNMMRVLSDMNVVGINASANDLYLQGLTLTAAFDF